MADDREDDFDSRIEEAKQFLRLASDADSTNRSEALEDLKFAAGDQWPVEIQNSRTLEARPCLTINKIDPFVRQITNQQRQQRPRMKCHGMNTQSDEKIAEIISGIFRHIEVQSDADQAYDNAFDFAVRMGWGYFRVCTDYISDKTFNQEIYIRQITNPFTVYFDPNSVLPDGSDAEKCMVTEVIPKDLFRKLYPGADDGAGFTLRGNGDSNAEWVMKEDIRIAEYFYTVRTPTKLLMFEDGSELYEDDYNKNPHLKRIGVNIIDKRDSYKKEIHWAKMTGMEILEEGVWSGRYIPIVPVYGQQLIVENKRKKYGIVRNAKDPQRMYNFWQTALTESVALAPKAKWVMAEGQDEGHESEWANANIKAYPLLRYKQKDIEGVPAPAPQRLQPEPPPTGVMSAMGVIDNDLKSVLGIFDPAQLQQGNISGKAINGQQQQSDMTNYNFYDNLTRSLRWTGKIILDLIPKIYDTERVMRIIGDDGKHELVTVNQQTADANGVSRVLNDLTVGEYDVVMDTGPGFNSKRQEAVTAMMPLISSNQTLFQLAGDLVFRNMDFPGADVIADRLAASNPLAQIDEKSDIPPQVQMQLAQSQQTIKQLQQQLQTMALDLKYGAQVSAIKEQGALSREMLKQTTKAHDTETNAQVKVNDQNTRSITSQNKSEIEGIVQLLLHHMDTARLEKEIDKRNQEQYQSAGQAVQTVMAQAPQTPQPLQ